MAIVAVDMEYVDFEGAPLGREPFLKLIVSDTDGKQYSLEIEGQALSEFAEIFHKLRNLIPRRPAVQ